MGGPRGTGSNVRHPPTSLFLLCIAKRDEATQQEAVNGPAGRASLPSQGAGISHVKRKTLRGTVKVLRKVEELECQWETFNYAWVKQLINSCIVTFFRWTCMFLINPTSHPADCAPVCLCVLLSSVFLSTVCKALCVETVCKANTCCWMSVWPVNYAEGPQTRPACVARWSSNEREAGGRLARRAAEHTENDSSNSGKSGYK